MKKIKKAKGFRVDHTKLEPGFYLSKRQHVRSGETIAYVTVFELRFFAPHDKYYLTQSGVHTIEHLGVNFLLDHPVVGDKIIHFGPMGSLTGFYLVVAGWYNADPNSECFAAVKDMLRYILNYTGDVPGATVEECGNYRLHDLWLAKLYAKEYLDTLEHNPCFNYPTLEVKT